MKKIEEANRLQIVEQYKIFDSKAEIAYDDITFLASQICKTAISTITFVDEKRQWFKSKIGFEHQESPKEMSFCALSISKNEEVIVIPNLMEDKDYSPIGKLNGLEKDGFYASVILYDEDKIPLGTLCVIDFESKTLNDDQIKGLKILGKQVEHLLYLRLKNRLLQLNFESINQKFNELNKFSGRISHDLHTPLNQLINLVELIDLNKTDDFKDNQEYLNLIASSTQNLKKYIESLLQYYKSEHNGKSIQDFSLHNLVNEVAALTNIDANAEIINEVAPNIIISNDKSAFSQILLNLITNGIKYNENKIPQIIIKGIKVKNKMQIEVSDNGIGMKPTEIESIFNPNKIITTKDRFGNYGNGLGMVTVKNLIDKINFDVEITSEIENGTTFTLVEK